MGDFSLTVEQGATTSCGPDWSRPDGYVADHHKLYVIESGAARYAIGDEWFDLEPGRLYFIPAHRCHRQLCPRRFLVHWFHVVVDALPLAQRLARARQPLSWPVHEWSAWRGTWTRIGEWHERRDPAIGARVHALALALVGAALERLPADPAADAAARLAPAVELLERRLPRSGVAVPVLARAVGLSTVQFHRAFRAAFGVTPHVWQARRRIDHAAALLADGRRSVADVAAACGFADPFYFSRVFRAHRGVPPQRWRAAQP